MNFDLFHYGGLCCFSFFKFVILPLLIKVCLKGIYFEIMWIPCYSSNFHPLAFSTYQWFLLESIIFMVVGDLILSLLLHLLVGIFLWGRAFPSSRSYISTELQILCSVVQIISFNAQALSGRRVGHGWAIKHVHPRFGLRDPLQASSWVILAHPSVLWAFPLLLGKWRCSSLLLFVLTRPQNQPLLQRAFFLFSRRWCLETRSWAPDAHP